MGRPSVNITIEKGKLGRQTAAADGISLLYVGLDTTSPLYTALSAGVVFYSLRNANGCLVWEHIKDFYAKAPEGTALHILAFNRTQTYATLFDAGNTNALSAYLGDNAGEIKMMGVAPNTRTADAATHHTITDITNSLALINNFAVAEFNRKRPLLVFLEGRNFNPSESVVNLRTITEASRVGVIVARDTQRVSVLVDKGIDNAVDMAAIGCLLGKLAAIPVQRSIARVKDGDLGWVSASFSGGNAVSSYTDGELDALNNKGYIFATRIIGKNGFFFNDDPTCVALTDDYAFVSHTRTIDKVVRIVNQVFVEELSDEIDIDASTGMMTVTTAKDLQNKCENALNQQMTVRGEVSAVNCFIDPNQNVLQTDTIEVAVEVVKKGTKRKFNIKVGFAISIAN
jgi:hypothetical protein